MDTQIVNISIPAQLLKLADEVAKNEARSRSELFREAIRNYVVRQKKWQKIFSFGQKQAKKLKIKETDVEKIFSDYRTGR